MSKLTKEDKKKLRQEKREKGKGLIAEFKKFINRGSVVDMAIGVVIATSFTKIVTALTQGIIMPFITWLLGDVKFDEFKTILRPEKLDVDGSIVQAEMAISWGTFIQAIIDFLLIAIVLFIILKVFNTIKEKKEYLIKKIKEQEEKEKKEQEEKEKKEEVKEPEVVVPAPPTTNELLTEILNTLKEKK